MQPKKSDFGFHTIGFGSATKTVATHKNVEKACFIA